MKITYRPEIDGLRAIAVFSVILYHANFILFNRSFFSGGFLGVDIFFVISGYLITSIILKEIYTKNDFSFINFYERRIRRIIPALLFVMLCTLPFAYIFLLIEPIIDFSKSIISSILFISNIYFNFTGNRYGEEHTLLKPFLHTWSLSVEEQFYILFPICLIFIIKFFRKYLLILLTIGFLISMSFSQFSHQNLNYYIIFKRTFVLNDVNFYQIFSRGFELLLGSFLSYFEINNEREGRTNKLLKQLLTTLGIFLIIFSFFFFSDKDLLPSFFSLVPLSGVCLIIWFSNKNDIITKILSNKILVFFGLISYSLYLFHYPIFAFARVIKIFDDYKFLFILLTIILSIFSYYCVEKLFRNKQIISSRNLVIILLCCIIFLITFNFYVIKNEGIKSRLPQIFHSELHKGVINFYQKDNLQKVILIGDSHSGSLEYHLNEEIKKNNLSLYRFHTRIFLKNFNYVVIKTKQFDKDFIKNNEKIDNFLKENSNLIVIFHQRWSILLLETFFDNEENYKEYKREEDKFYDYLEPININTTSQSEREKYIKDGLISEINNIINQGHKLILVYPVPEMAFAPQKLLYLRMIKENLFNKENITSTILTGSYEVYKKRNQKIFEIFDSIKSSNIYRVYPHSHFCDKQIKNRCVANDKENIFYYDGNHLSLSGSKYVVDDIIKIIQQIEFEKKIKSSKTISSQN